MFVPILIFLVSVISLVFFSFKISNSTVSNLEENDLGSRSNVSVSPTKFNSLSKNITLSKFWKRNLVENKKLLMSSSTNFTFNLVRLSIVLLITSIWFDDFFLLNLVEHF